MLLNDFQKNLLGYINQPLDSEKRIKDINSFFELTCDIEKEGIACSWVTSDFNPTLENQNIYTVEIDEFKQQLGILNKGVYFKDNKQVIYNTVYFLELVDFLEREKLITYIDKSPSELVKFKVPVLKNTQLIGIHDVHPIDDRLWLLIREFVLCEIVPLPELNDYINNQNKTKEEINVQTEIKDRRQQLELTRRTLILTVIALFVSVVMNFVSIYLYTTERNISIVRDVTKEDTSKVKIVNYPIVDTVKKIDSIVIKK